MKKKNFILIGIAILVSLFSTFIPFIGFGEAGFQITSLPLGFAVSILLIIFATSGLYKDTNIQEFFTAKVMAIISFCVIVIGTIISPFFSKVTYLSIFEYFETIINAAQYEDARAILVYFRNILTCFAIQFICSAIASFFMIYSFSNIASGICSFNIESTYKINLKRNFKQFAITTFINFTLVAIMMFLLSSFYKILIPLTNSDVFPAEDVIPMLLIFFVLFFVIMPAGIINVVFYYISLIKSTIYAFKAPSKIMNDQIHNSDY